MSAPEAGTAETQFPCGQCGAKLEFQPGAETLKCHYCGFENAIRKSEAEVEELDFEAFLAEAASKADQCERLTVKCSSCAAESSFDPHITSAHCPFCGAGIVAEGVSRKAIKPKALLPFKVTREQALAEFKKWVAGLWFAPGELRRYARTEERLNGLYVPYWTYDSATTSFYHGSRGDDYWVSESYTSTVNGRSVTKTRQVRKTRWRAVSGTVRNRFDDLLVLASRTLPEQYARKLEPWDLAQLVPYQDEFLSGFRAESYQVDLQAGFEHARKSMDEAIRAAVCSDIGGDHQRIDSVKTQYREITFKHLLLPIWLFAYRYRERVFRILVNARTGEVQGERPWSWAKIALAVLAVLAGLAAVLALAALAASN